MQIAFKQAQKLDLIRPNFETLHINETQIADPIFNRIKGCQFGRPFALLEKCNSRDEAQPFGVQNESLSICTMKKEKVRYV